MGSKERGKIRRLYREHGLPKFLKGNLVGVAFGISTLVKYALKEILI
ncbi:hypothetical protein [Thermococcus sp.]